MELQCAWQLNSRDFGALQDKLVNEEDLCDDSHCLAEPDNKMHLLAVCFNFQDMANLKLWNYRPAGGPEWS